MIKLSLSITREISSANGGSKQACSSFKSLSVVLDSG